MILATAVVALVAALAGQPPPQPELRSGPSAQTFKPEELCTVEGNVQDVRTGQPLRRVNIILMRLDAGPGPGATRAPVTATSADGRFGLKDIEPGRYRISADRTGYVRQEYGARKPGTLGTTLTLEKGQSVKDLEIKLSPQAVISGRILDEDGEPMQHAMVSLVRQRFFQGRKRYEPSHSASSNDLGDYRIFGISPGKYLLTAVSPQSRYPYGVDRSAAERPEEAYAASFYPGVDDPAIAAAFDVAAGSLLQGMDLTLRRIRAYRVRGQVSGLESGRSRGPSVWLTPKGGRGLSYLDRGVAAIVGPGGNFEVRGVKPGGYTIHAESRDGQERLTARAKVEVANSDVEGIFLNLGPGLSVAGSVRLEGKGALKPEELQVWLEADSESAVSNPSPGRPKADGGFFIPNAGQDVYAVRVGDLPAGYYLASARMHDADVLESGLDLAVKGSVKGLELIVRQGAPVVEGVVVDTQGNALVGAIVVIHSVSEKPSPSRLTRTAVAATGGSYRFQGLPPGEYRIAAFEDLDPNEATDPDLFRRYEKAVRKVELKEGEKKQTPVTAIKTESGGGPGR